MLAQLYQRKYNSKFIGMYCHLLHIKIIAGVCPSSWYLEVNCTVPQITGNVDCLVSFHFLSWNFFISLMFHFIFLKFHFLQLFHWILAIVFNFMKLILWAFLYTIVLFASSISSSGIAITLHFHTFRISSAPFECSSSHLLISTWTCRFRGFPRMSTPASLFSS